MSKCGAYARSTGQPCEAPVVPKKSGVADTAVFQRDPRRKKGDGELRTPRGVSFNVNWHELGSWGTDNRANGLKLSHPGPHPGRNKGLAVSS